MTNFVEIAHPRTLRNPLLQSVRVLTKPLVRRLESDRVKAAEALPPLAPGGGWE